jgi:endoglucanase
MGYSSLIKHHYGYIGRWMGTYGKLSLDEYVGKQFKLIQNEKEVYSGTIEWRLKEDPRYLVKGLNTSLNGEETLLLDISNYTGRGENYYFYIEGIGRSLNFSISYKGVFTAFYTHMKGLYNQRTGIEHKKPYTYWEVPPHHKGIYVAHHIPNNYHYSKNYIIDDNTNEGFDGLTQFKMIKETRTDEYWEEVYGGHADAGDYDNRPYHLSMIDVLACVYLLRKDLLMDNQLNIPESNDNIPDILNELEWSLLIHYKVQQRLNNGSVSTWIESTSHPGEFYDNGTDPARYYVGLSTREDTLRYAEAAAMLSFCFKECNFYAEDKYKKWLKSAEWAFNWGINKDNQCIYSFTFEGRNLTYREP